MPRLLDGNTSQLAAPLDASRRVETGTLDELFSLMYAELPQLAHPRLSRSERPTQLDTTSLVRASYLRCHGGGGQRDLDNRAHFLAYADKVMRSSSSPSRGTGRRGSIHFSEGAALQPCRAAVQASHSARGRETLCVTYSPSDGCWPD